MHAISVDVAVPKELVGRAIGLTVIPLELTLSVSPEVLKRWGQLTGRGFDGDQTAAELQRMGEHITVSRREPSWLPANEVNRDKLFASIADLIMPIAYDDRRGVWVACTVLARTNARGAARMAGKTSRKPHPPNKTKWRKHREPRIMSSAA